VDSVKWGSELRQCKDLDDTLKEVPLGALRASRLLIQLNPFFLTSSPRMRLPLSGWAAR
jgi:hypothetical protein